MSYVHFLDPPWAEQMLKLPELHQDELEKDQYLFQTLDINIWID